MKIGIIEDDELLNQALTAVLKSQGYITVGMQNKKEALRLVDGSIDFLIVDIGLPDGNGIDLYQEICKRFTIPALFLTARDEEKDMLDAYDSGAEDYVVKPFSMKVLLKRVEIILRRSSEEKKFTCGDLALFVDRKQVLLKNREIELTAKEYQLLEYLMINHGQVLTKENILEQIWGVDGQFVVENAVSVLINRIRKKIESDVKQPVYIRNVFGLGYRMGE